MPLFNLPKLLPPNLPNLPTKINHARAQWVVLPIMEDDGCRLIYVKVTNPNIIKVLAKSTCITHPLN